MHVVHGNQQLLPEILNMSNGEWGVLVVLKKVVNGLGEEIKYHTVMVAVIEDGMQLNAISNPSSECMISILYAKAYKR